MDYTIVSDSKWHYTAQANPRRGYHDYGRTIEVSRPLTDEEKKQLTEQLKKEPNCPQGQEEVNLSGYDSTATSLYFRCCCDSGD
jgi:hypothetical protein